MVAQETPDTPAEEGPEVATVTRTIKFEVSWPGWRRTQLRALWKEMWTAQNDLRRAANLAISALFQLKIGAIAWPEKDGKKTSLRTLCYQALSGKWQPFDEPMYVATTARPVSSQALLELSTMLYTRIQTDWVDIQMGRRSLPTWRSMPLGSSNQGIQVDRDTGEVSFPLWGGRGGGGRVRVRPRKLDPSSWAGLRGALKYGNARLVWHKPNGRKGRWMLSLSVTQPTRRDLSSAPLIAAVRLGMYTTCTLAYATIEGGKLKRWCDRIDLPSSTHRQVRRVARERTERGRWNRRSHGARSGRGRRRKLRATRQIGDVVARVTDTAVQQVAAAVVAQAVRRGARTIALPDLKHWSVDQEMDRTEPMPRGSRAEHRKWYFRWHQGALRQKIEHAAEREGLSVVHVDVSRCSVTCSGCGQVNLSARSQGRWACECGCQLSVEENTARVLVQRAVSS